MSFSFAGLSVETLAPSVLAFVDTLKRVGPSAADVEKVKAQQLRALETSLKLNAFWRTNIESRDQAGEDLAGLLDETAMRTLTPAKIQASANKYLNQANFARFVLLPEGKAP